MKSTGSIRIRLIRFQIPYRFIARSTPAGNRDLLQVPVEGNMRSILWSKADSIVPLIIPVKKNTIPVLVFHTAGLAKIT